MNVTTCFQRVVPVTKEALESRFGELNSYLKTTTQGLGETVWKVWKAEFVQHSYPEIRWVVGPVPHKTNAREAARIFHDSAYTVFKGAIHWTRWDLKSLAGVVKVLGVPR